MALLGAGMAVESSSVLVLLVFLESVISMLKMHMYECCGQSSAANFPIFSAGRKFGFVMAILAPRSSSSALILAHAPELLLDSLIDPVVEYQRIDRMAPLTKELHLMS